MANQALFAYLGLQSVPEGAAATLSISVGTAQTGSGRIGLYSNTSGTELLGVVVAGTSIAQFNNDVVNAALAVAGPITSTKNIKVADIDGGYTPTGGEIRFAGGDLEGYAGGSWKSLTAAGGATSPGGADTNVQYNDSGVFAGSTDFTWSDTTRVLTLTHANAAGGVPGVVLVGSNGDNSTTSGTIASFQRDTSVVTTDFGVVLTATDQFRLNAFTRDVMVVSGQEQLTFGPLAPLVSGDYPLQQTFNTRAFAIRTAAAGAQFDFTSGGLQLGGAGPIVDTLTVDVDGGSVDTELPTAKGVYDAIQAAVGTIDGDPSQGEVSTDVVDRTTSSTSFAALPLTVTITPRLTDALIELDIPLLGTDGLGTATAEFRILRGATPIATWQTPPEPVRYIIKDTGATALAANVYTVEWRRVSGTVPLLIANSAQRSFLKGLEVS